jgi:hypothetical protein
MGRNCLKRTAPTGRFSSSSREKSGSRTMPARNPSGRIASSTACSSSARLSARSSTCRPCAPTTSSRRSSRAIRHYRRSCWCRGCASNWPTSCRSRTSRSKKRRRNGSRPKRRERPPNNSTSSFGRRRCHGSCRGVRHPAAPAARSDGRRGRARRGYHVHGEIALESTPFGAEQLDTRFNVGPPNRRRASPLLVLPGASSRRCQTRQSEASAQ